MSVKMSKNTLSRLWFFPIREDLFSKALASQKNGSRIELTSIKGIYIFWAPLFVIWDCIFGNGGDFIISGPFVTVWHWKMTGSPGQTRPLIWINMSSSWEKICKLIFFQIPVGIWWHWVSRRHYLLVLGGTASVLGSTDWYLIVLGR